jgi:hypothetical protein
MAETTVLRSSSINRTPNAGAKPQAQLSGVHKVVQVNMNSGGPQVQNGQSTVRQGVTLLPPKGARRNFTTGGLPNQPAKQGVVILPPKEMRAAVAATPLTADHLMLCRHLVDKYRADLPVGTAEAPVESTITDNAKLAESAIVAIDATMAAMTAMAAAAAVEATAAVAVDANAAVPPPPRAVTAGTRSTHGAASATPRRVARPAGPPPAPIVVKMEAGEPVRVAPDQTDAPQG